MARVLVTGSSGFVGRILTPLLEDAGHEVWGADRVADGERTLACDLQDRQALDAMLDEVSPRYIVHLAAQSSGAISFDEPHETIQNNFAPVLHLLEHLRTRGRDTRLLAIGSADVYGAVGAAQLPLRETEALMPPNPYALSKWLQEQCCTHFAQLYEIDVVMTRSFNHSGAGQSDRFVLASFARQVVEIARGSRDAKVMVGNVDVRRDFSDVRDVCDAYAALLDRGAAGEIYNVCSGESHSLREILERIAAIAGVQIEIEVDPKRVRPNDTEELRGDRSKLEAATGWQPKHTLDDTLQDLVKYWQAQLI